MIKFSLRRNLTHPLQYLIYHQLSNNAKLIKHFYNINSELIYCSLMFMGQFIFGLIFYLRHKRFVTKNKIIKNKSQRHMYIELIKTESRLRKIDSVGKIIFLIFSATGYDILEFVIIFKTPKIINISIFFQDRLRGFMTIINALFFFYFIITYFSASIIIFNYYWSMFVNNNRYRICFSRI